MKNMRILLLLVSLLIVSFAIFACAASDLIETDGAVISPSTTAGVVTTTAPATTTTPVTTTAPTPTTAPITAEKPDTLPATTAEPTKTCTDHFADGLATAGKTLTLSRELTADELQALIAHIREDKALRMVLACGQETFYRPEDLSLYELLYASDIKVEYPDNPYGNNGSMMTTARIKEVVKQYLGIDVTKEMLDKLVADGAEYYPDLDAYGFSHTDLSAFYPDDGGFAYETADGKLLVHLIQAGPGQHLTALLIPNGATYRVEAAQWILASHAED